MTIRVEVERQPAGRVTVRLHGRLDSQGAADCKDAVEKALAPPARFAVFDMAGVSFLASMGLRLLFMARSTMRARGGDAVITNLQLQVAKVFEIIAALPSDGVFASLEEADAYLAAMQERELERSGST